MPQTFAFVNGRQIPEQDVRIGLDDFGFIRGNTVFELARVYGEHPFELTAHLDRLEASLRLCHIPQRFTRQELKAQISALIRTHKFADSVIKIYVTQGATKATGYSLGITATSCDPQLIVLNQPFTPFSADYPYHERYYKEGLKLASLHAERPLAAAKTTSYIQATAASSEHLADGMDDILYINSHGCVTESSRSNIFFTRGAHIITPAHGMLDGITRRVVLDILTELNIPAEVRDVPLTELPKMDGGFTTASTTEIVPVQSVDTIRWQADNALIQRIRTAFAARVAACRGAGTSLKTA
ncbi:MAG: hypothetical protein GC134_03880 [Proteobacteria bacterium]|nr:hypothetical protein [Pseudomonadota bacterium]